MKRATFKVLIYLKQTKKKNDDLIGIYARIYGVNKINLIVFRLSCFACLKL